MSDKSPRFAARWADGTFLPQHTEITTFRGDRWIYAGTSHSRKIYVYWDQSPNGEKRYPNRISQEFYPTVVNRTNHGNLGIWDFDHEEWSFEPETDKYQRPGERLELEALD